MQTRHRRILITEPILRPHAPLATIPVHRIHEPIFPRFLTTRSRHIRIRQQPRRHAQPKREDNERKQIAHRHCAAVGFVEAWRRGAAPSRGGVVVQQREEEDCPRDVDGVDTIDLRH